MAIANLYSGALAFPTLTSNTLATGTTVTLTYGQMGYQVDGRSFVKAGLSNQTVPTYDSASLQLFTAIPLLSSGSGASLTGQASVYVVAYSAAFTGNLITGSPQIVTGNGIVGSPTNTVTSTITQGTSIVISQATTANMAQVTINGVQYAVSGAVGATTLTVGSIGVFQGSVVPVDQSGNLVVGRPNFPTIPAGWCPFGYIVVINNTGSNFTFGGTSWSAVTGNGSAVWVDSVAYLPERPQNF